MIRCVTQVFLVFGLLILKRWICKSSHNSFKLQKVFSTNRRQLCIFQLWTFRIKTFQNSLWWKLKTTTLLDLFVAAKFVWTLELHFLTVQHVDRTREDRRADQIHRVFMMKNSSFTGRRKFPVTSAIKPTAITTSTLFPVKNAKNTPKERPNKTISKQFMNPKIQKKWRRRRWGANKFLDMADDAQQPSKKGERQMTIQHIEIMCD